MRFTYDPDADAAYVYLVDEIPPGAVARTAMCDVEFDGGSVHLDLDSGGRLLGIEILGCRAVLREVP